jgi:nucleoside-diphosphate-sugar epimerase
MSTVTLPAPAEVTLPDPESPVLVAGAGGFIGGHLVADLRQRGHRAIRAVDHKPLGVWHHLDLEADNRVLDLSRPEACAEATDGVRWVYDLAADTGGMGFIESNRARCMLSVLIGTNLLVAAEAAGVERFFFASSARVYAAEHQWLPDVTPLRETDAYPAEPEDGYGWEKLFTERMCRHFSEDFGLATRVARYHNVYGPDGTFEGGREKAPAAICRKVALARLSGDHRVEIWGDGRQTRSFTYIDDCIYGTQLLTGSDVEEPLNIGSSELVTIDQLVDIVEEIAGIQVERSYRTDAPQGVRGRNSDNTLIQELLGWEPSVSLRKGLDQTFQWVHDRLAARL